MFPSPSTLLLAARDEKLRCAERQLEVSKMSPASCSLWGWGWECGWESTTSWRNQSNLIPRGNVVRAGAAQPSPTLCPLCIPTSCPTAAGNEPLALWRCLRVQEQWRAKGLQQHRCGENLNGFSLPPGKLPSQWGVRATDVRADLFLIFWGDF